MEEGRCRNGADLPRLRIDARFPLRSSMLQVFIVRMDPSFGMPSPKGPYV